MNRMAMSILLIEDFSDDAEIVTRMLRSHDELLCELTHVEYLAEGIVNILNAPAGKGYDIALVDLHLPDSDGIATVCKLRAVAPDLPLIVFTAAHDAHLGIDAIGQGAQDYIVKGNVDPVQFARILQYTLLRKRHELESQAVARRFRAIFEAAGNAMVVVDRNFIIVDANRSMAQLTGHPVESLVGEAVSQFVVSDAELYTTVTAAEGQPGSDARLKALLRCRPNAEVAVECVISSLPALQAGGADYLIVFHDISRYVAEVDKLSQAYATQYGISRRMADELKIAREIQQNLYPSRIDTIEGLTIEARLDQAEQVGGDYYDVVRINEHEIVVVIADVEGHDVAAAFIVGMAKMAFLSHLPLYYEHPAEIMRHVNEDLMKVISNGRYLTAFCIYFNAYRKLARFCCAGHIPQYLFRSRDGAIEALHTDGFFLGIFDDGDYQEKTISLGSGDKLIMFTDGLIEIKNPRNELCGRERVEELIRESGRETAAGLHALLLEQQREFAQGVPFDDDTCLIVCEVSSCASEEQILEIFGTPSISQPPCVLCTPETVEDSISEILVTLDRHGYPDRFIRSMKRFSRRLGDAFFANAHAAGSRMKFLGDISPAGAKFAFLLEPDTVGPGDLFKSPTCRGIIASFADGLGQVEVNRIGDRLTITMPAPAG